MIVELALAVLDPLRAVAIVALMSVLAGLQGLWIVRAEIMNHPYRLARFLVPGLIGVPVGVSLLEILDAGTLRLGIAVLLKLVAQTNCNLPVCARVL